MASCGTSDLESVPTHEQISPHEITPFSETCPLKSLILRSIIPSRREDSSMKMARQNLKVERGSEKR
uniref:Uncharacterized protein n=1 Tax=Setaria digitata TaxID=48799 RepID=A0A915Q5F4_9BILA